ncbi:hypothetical protein [Streptomyces californicus]|uniref:hypothetical protein n=1 Tax=Streptomyces californicus TaxID=67351 RepID=UPI00296EA60B|nr:hypothetical protein [Streptomyces californicus]MDW4912549.1 hypothetical protein [Streptomyces californicus]
MSDVIECQASRRGRLWVAHLPEHGVYGSGRTLRLVRASVENGLALVGVTTEAKIIPVTPELETLRAAEDARTTALANAVEALALRRTSLSDIALATGASVKQVKLLLARPAEDRRVHADPAPLRREPARQPPCRDEENTSW